MPNPFTDFWNFLIGNTDDYNSLGAWKYPLVVLFWLLLAGSFAIAAKSWADDPAQRTGTGIGTWLARILVGGMWYQGMVWKLPFPVSDGLRFWTEQMGERAAFEFHRQIVENFYLPHLYILDPIVFLAELAFAVSLLLGLATRLVGILAVIYVLHLWLGLYAPGDPSEWPWTYVFLALLEFLFALYAAGRSLGADALLRRRVKPGVFGSVVKLAG
jgi:uncharacterized membrane protein YphA (DoxX/SURF4 family)